MTRAVHALHANRRTPCRHSGNPLDAPGCFLICRPFPTVIRTLRPPLVITAIYSTFAGVWIAASDQVLGALFRNPHALVQASTYKGIAFVAVTALLLYGLLLRREAQHRAALTALAGSEARFRATFEQAAVGIAHVALDGHWLRVNEKLCAFLGYRREELLAMNFQQLTHPDDLAADLDLVRRLLDGRLATYSMDKRYLTRTGQLVWGNLTVALVRRPDGQPDYFISVVVDIAARKQAEAALRQSEENYHDLFAGNPQPMWVFDRETLRFLDVNAAAIDHYGYTRDEFLAMDIRGIRAPAECARLTQVLAEDPPGQGKHGLWQHRTKDGRHIQVEVHSSDLHFQGRAAKMVLAHDVTARLAAEQALQDAMQRLRVLSGRLLDVQEAERRNVARELHDETGQSLTAIKIILQTVQRQHPELHGALTDVVAAADRTLEQVRELSRGLWPSQLDDLGLAAALRGMVTRLSRHGHTEITLNAPEQLPFLPPAVAATCFRVTQEALTNIVRHAEADTATVRLQVAADQLLLTIDDNGRGFPAAETLATAGQRSLGLLGMRERAALASGALEIASTPGVGTRITLQLPLGAP